jgi:hypothetical protein
MPFLTIVFVALYVGPIWSRAWRALKKGAKVPQISLRARARDRCFNTEWIMIDRRGGIHREPKNPEP